MKTIVLGNIEIQFDLKTTQEFYATQDGFTCQCADCLDYVNKIPVVKDLLNGLDDILGIDLTKAVGQGMDELMGHDNEDHCLYVVPYYIVGRCRLNGNDLRKTKNGPIWPNTIRAEHRINDNLNLSIINTTGSVRLDSAESVITIWVEFKTELKK